MTQSFNNCHPVSSKKCLKVAHVNVENLLVHRDPFFDLFKDNHYDVVAVTETFLKPEISSQPLMLDEYDFVRHDRLNKEGGGVAVYFKKSFNCKVIASSQASYCRKPEFLIIELSFGWKLLLCVVYRPPKLGFISEFFDVVANLLPLYGNVLILGDFNVDLATDRQFADKTEFLNLASNLDLSILPLRPTYHLPQSDTWLDLIIFNDINRVKSFGQHPVAGISYHDLIYVELNLKVRLANDKEIIVARDYKNIQLDSLKEECSNLDFNYLYTMSTVNEKVDYFSHKIEHIFNKSVPQRKISKNRNPCPWITLEIRTQIKERDKLYRQFLRTKDVLIWESYRLIRNRVKRLTRDGRNRYFNSLLQLDKPSKDVWKVIKNQGAGKQCNKLGNPIVDLNDLNAYFCGINNEINRNIIEYYLAKRSLDVNSYFNFVDVNDKDVYEVLNKISSNAVGNDGIPLKFIKLVFDHVKPVLVHIFNASMNSASYPSQWKRAIILPLPKIVNPTECKNYRPINLLCVLGKMLDKLVYKQIYKFVNDNNLLYKYQSGYRTHFSTQSALVKINDDIRFGIDKGYITVMMLLDFSRAFDCVNHELLIAILKSYNFSENVVQWFVSYLENRQQHIRTAEGLVSEWKHNPLGVPQGSTLSSLLFSLYINRICENVIFSNVMLYADDMQLYIQCKSDKINDSVNQLNSDLSNIYYWCNDHGLRLNILKCKPIILGSARILNNLDLNNVTPVEVNGQVVAYEKSVLNLGLRIMNNMSWTDQVNYVCKKVYQCLYQFKRLCFKPPPYIKKQLVLSLIFPYFDYAICAYCDLNEELTNKLQVAQNSCIRYIFNLRLDEHVTRYYKDLQWLKIKERRELHILNLLFKTLKYKKPDYLYEKYRTMQNVHLRQTRFGNDILQFPIHRTVVYSKSFHVQSIRLMNSLDRSFKEENSEKKFVKKVKVLLLQRYDE